MEFNDAAFKVFITIAGTAYTVIFGMIAKKVWDIPSQVESKLDEFERTLEKKFDKLESEARSAHSRIDVHDRISSKLSGEDFDSRSVATHGRYPMVKKLNYDEF